MHEEYCPLFYATLQAFKRPDYLLQGSLSHMVSCFDGQAWPKAGKKKKNRGRKIRWTL